MGTPRLIRGDGGPHHQATIQAGLCADSGGAQSLGFPRRFCVPRRPGERGRRRPPPWSVVLPLIMVPVPTAYGGQRLGVIFTSKGHCRGAGSGGVCVCGCLTHHHPFQRAPTFSLTARAMLSFCFPSPASGNQSPFISLLRCQVQNKLLSLTLNIFFPQ